MSKRSRRGQRIADVNSNRYHTNLLPDYEPYFTAKDVTVDNRFYNPAQEHHPVIVGSSLKRVNQQVRHKARTASFPRPVGGRDYLNVKDWMRAPRETMICLRRRARKAVLFALNRTGKGSGNKKQKKYTEDSTVKCRR